MNIVKINDNLIENNLGIISATKVKLASSEILSGTIYNGYNKVYANILPGQGEAKVNFNLVIPSIDAQTFDAFRLEVAKILGKSEESQIKIAAGIENPPPLPASRMSQYAVSLFSDIFWVNGIPEAEKYLNQNTSFSQENCEKDGCMKLLKLVRSLQVSRIKFYGTLEVNSTATKSNSAAVYIPVTSVVFKDNVTIPFAGYSNNVNLKIDNSDLGINVPEAFWNQ